MLAKRTSKNQLTLPKEIADSFKEFTYFDVSAKNNQIILNPVKILPAGPSLESIRLKMKRLGITEDDVRDAVKWARQKTH